MCGGFARVQQSVFRFLGLLSGLRRGTEIILVEFVVGRGKQEQGLVGEIEIVFVEGRIFILFFGGGGHGWMGHSGRWMAFVVVWIVRTSFDRKQTVPDGISKNHEICSGKNLDLVKRDC